MTGHRGGGEPAPPRGEGDRPRSDAAPPRGEGDRPRGEPAPPRGEGDRPRGEPAPPRGEGDRPRGEPAPPRGEPAPSRGEPAPPRGEPAPPRQASLRRLREFGVRPNRELGQNFLIDDNILRVIGSAAELDGGDVVLEVGGGLGVLSEFLAPEVAHLHVVEVDRSLEEPLRDALGSFERVTLHLADAVRMDFAELEPAPNKVVANLPYGVAATVLLKSIAELPDAELWVAMVQREVADRLAAAPGGKSYGATSVLAQLACDVRFLRKVPRTVFHPEPNVDSALVVLRRRAPAPPGELIALVHAGFAHRRKALPGSLALAPGAPEGIRDAAREALVQLGHPADTRAERLAPAEWEGMAAALGRERLAGLRPRSH